MYGITPNRGGVLRLQDLKKEPTTPKQYTLNTTGDMGQQQGPEQYPAVKAQVYQPQPVIDPTMPGFDPGFMNTYQPPAPAPNIDPTMPGYNPGVSELQYQDWYAQQPVQPNIDPTMPGYDPYNALAQQVSAQTSVPVEQKNQLAAVTQPTGYAPSRFGISPYSLRDGQKPVYGMSTYNSLGGLPPWRTR